MEITKDDTIMEALQKNPEAGRILNGFGMHCIGCALSRGETVEQAATAHGVDINAMLDALNNK